MSFWKVTPTDFSGIYGIFRSIERAHSKVTLLSGLIIDHYPIDIGILQLLGTFAIHVKMFVQMRRPIGRVRMWDVSS
jgi:hypothetical protein